MIHFHSTQYNQSFPHRQLSSSSGGYGESVEVCIEKNHPDGPDHRDINRAFEQVDILLIFLLGKSYSFFCSSSLRFKRALSRSDTILSLCGIS